MTKRDWDYSLKLKGVTLETIGMGRLAEYMAQFAELLGHAAKPVFAGVVRGSVILRARDRNEWPAVTRSRMRAAANDDGAPGRDAYQRIAGLLQADGARGVVIDKAEEEIIAFPSARPPPMAKEYFVADTAEIDGVVVGVEGIDATAHVRILDQSTKATISVQVRDMEVARHAAAHFRGPVIRIKVHGTWKRDGEGAWGPHSLYADSIEVLVQQTAKETFDDLRAIPNIGWRSVGRGEADSLLEELRGDE